MSFARYPDYRDSGVDWLGDVPAHWEVVPLRHAARLVTERATENTNPIALENIESWTGRFVHSDTEFQAEGIAFERDDILYGKLRPYLAKTLVAKVAGQAVGDFHVIRPQQRTSASFIGYFLRTRETVSILDGSTHGSKMPRVAWQVLATRPFLRPPPSEQAAIATFLDRETSKIDDLIEEQRRLVVLLKEKRQAIISHAVTKGLNPNAPMKPSGIEWLGDVPAHWGVKRLATVFVEIAEKGNDDLPILSVSIHNGVSDGELDDFELDRKVTRSEDRSKYKRVSKGDLVYNMMRAWQGGFGSVALDGQVSPAYVVARPQGSISSDYAESVLRTPQAIEQMRRHSKGVTDFRLRLYWDEFKNLRLPLPPIDEQSSILVRVACENAACSKLVREAEKAITLLQERRAALISAAVTGKIDVRSEVADSPSLRPALTVIEGDRSNEPIKSTTQAVSTSRVRLLVAARVAERLADKPTFGRTQMQKYLHLAENHIGIEELNGHFERQAAGPLDRSQLDDVEHALLEAKIAVTSQEQIGRRVTYKLMPNRPNLHSELIAAIGKEKASALDELIDLMESFTTPSVEAVATLYAAWNDALIDRLEIDDATLTKEVETNWHPDKHIPHATLVDMLAWMKRTGVVPTGTGRKTIPTMQGSLL